MQSILKRTLSVSQVNEYIAIGMEHDPVLRNLRIRGEISNCRVTAAGHCYFALKDQDALINCVCFKSHYLSLPFDPKDGQHVCGIGYVSIYKASGQLQFYVQDMEKEGLGELYEAYEALKIKLDEKGYFALERKKTIPKYPAKIAIITSPTGAVIHDFTKVAWGRNSSQKILLIPSKVQGQGAAEEIAEAINIANNAGDVDLIVLARGGGSIEDLWAFNEEIVANAIFNSKKPIVTAIGHESDFTIADFVADLRTSTPSHAAELTTPVLKDAHSDLDELNYKLNKFLKDKIDSNKLKLVMNIRKLHIEKLRRKIHGYLQDMDVVYQKVERSSQKLIETRRNQLEKIQLRLEAFSCDSALNRGYAIIIGKNGVIDSIDKLSKDDKIEIRMIDGSAEAVVKKINEFEVS